MYAITYLGRIYQIALIDVIKQIDHSKEINRHYIHSMP